MHRSEPAAKPHLQYTPPNREARSPKCLTFKCAVCGGPKYGKRAEMCRQCRCNARRPPIDDKFYEIRGRSARRIALTRGQYTFVDARNYKRLLEWSWNAQKKTGKQVYYASTQAWLDGKPVMARMHHVILGLPTCVECDHKNRNTLDNLEDNLRPCSDQQNASNQGLARNNTSGYKGVIWRKERKRWRAVINFERKRRFLGTFKTAPEAARAYDRAALRYFGEFACLNFPNAS